MRVVVSLVSAAVSAVFLASVAYADDWAEYVNRGDFFTINFPGDPDVKEIKYKTAKGTELPAHLYSAQDARGQYRITVVDYNGDLAELPTAMDEASDNVRKMGAVKYDAINQLDNHRSQRISVETGQRIILAEILAAMNNRLYISEAETALNVPPPAQFQASLQILNNEGVRIRYKEGTPAKPDEVLPVSPQAYGEETARVVGLISGAWKAPGTSCDTAFFKTGDKTMTSRGEEAITATLVNAGVNFTGQAITSGAREGQFIDPKTDHAILLFDPMDKSLPLSFIGAPALGWPDVTLEPCK